MSKQLVDGLNDCSNADYHKDRKYLSSSVLKVIYKDLAEYKSQYIDGNKKEMSNQGALDEGSLTHAYLLDPATIKTEYAFYPGLRKAGADWEAFKASLDPDSGHKIIISKPQKLKVESYVKAFKARPEAVEMLKDGAAEQTICGTLNGVPIKVRFDYINVDKGAIYDVKTTGYPADVDSFKQTLNGLSYQLSAALYCALAEQYYNRKFDFYFIVISKSELECHVYKTSDKTMSEGRRMVDVACAKYLKAKETNVWIEPEVEVENEISNYEILEV
ncbi:MAG: PD-(D/E)XK nuclease-like domain-containing protein [Candidatus Paceibacterota bacterium]